MGLNRATHDKIRFNEMGVKAYYTAPVSGFLEEDSERILGILTKAHHHSLEEPQRSAWLDEITILKNALSTQRTGQIFLEFYIPRMGKRADALLITDSLVFVIEFKTATREHSAQALEQVHDYALDLKNFHEGSHDAAIVPVLVSTHAASEAVSDLKFAGDIVASPVKTNDADLGPLLDQICALHKGPALDIADWMAKGYRPTPTIIEAAQVLYQTHNVSDISRREAGAKNLAETSECVGAIIELSRENGTKSICFVTGVPGSGKTLAGLNIATRRSEEHVEDHAVFLSGNGPLVQVLREALARDKAHREQISKKTANERYVALSKTFITFETSMSATLVSQSKR